MGLPTDLLSKLISLSLNYQSLSQHSQTPSFQDTYVWNSFLNTNPKYLNPNNNHVCQPRASRAGIDEATVLHMLGTLYI